MTDLKQKFEQGEENNFSVSQVPDSNSTEQISRRNLIMKMKNQLNFTAKSNMEQMHNSLINPFKSIEANPENNSALDDLLDE